MADIFISYASEDRSRAEPIAKALEEQGWSVWWDRTIPPGSTFDEVIEEALDSAHCVIVIWSKASVASNWVKTEASEGVRKGFLVPALIEDVQIPLEFRRIQAADLTNWDSEKEHPGFISLRNAISEVAGPPEERDESARAIKHPEAYSEQQLEVKPKESETFQPDPSYLKPDEKESPVVGPKAPRKKQLAFGIGAVALILVVSVIGWFFYLKNEHYTNKTLPGPDASIFPPSSVPTKEYRLSGIESMDSGMNKNMVNHDFELTFDVKPMLDSENDIVGAFESNGAVWKIYFPSDGDIIRFISRNFSMRNTTKIDAKFSRFGKIGEWNNIILKRKNNIVSLYINGKKAGQKSLIGDMPVLSSEVKFGYLGSYLTDIFVKNIQTK